MNVIIERWLKNRKKYKWEDTTSSGGDNSTNIKSEEVTCSKEDAPTPVNNRPPKRKKRRYYHDNYLAFGFVCSNQDGDLQRPLCVICKETLANESMRPAKLRRHLEAKHKEFCDKPMEYFASKQLELSTAEPKKPVCKAAATGRDNENAVLASYDVSLLIANSGIPHTIAEELILPAAKAIACRMHGPEAADNYNTISLSNTTVKRRIENMSENVKSQLLKRVFASQYYSLLLDESTDVCDKIYLLLFIRYEYQNKINEDFLFCHSLPADASSDDIFITLNDVILANLIGWPKCVGVCTDGSLISSSKYQRVLQRIQSIGPLIKLTHCCVHRESLAIRQMPAKLKTALDEAIQVVNMIKTCTSNSQVINILCQEMGSAHEQLLIHSQGHWLSRGKVLTRMFDLRDEIRLILIEKAFVGSEWFKDFTWLAMVAYLADIFAYLNDITLSLQGRTMTVFHVQEKIETFLVKLEMWIKYIQSSIFGAFPTLCDFLSISQLKITEETKSIFIEHLQSLQRNLREYFPVLDRNDLWIRDPFLVNVNDICDFSVEERNSFINLTQDLLMRSHFNQSNLGDFWLHAKTEHPLLASRALRYLMPFASTCLCEHAVSQLIFIKSKYRTRMNVEPDLRLKLSSIEPEIQNIVSTKQHQPSH